MRRMLITACILICETTFAWSDAHLQIALPKDWGIKLISQDRSANDQPTWTYQVSSSQKDLFKVIVVNGGSPFIECLCAPKKEYKHKKTKKREVWTFETKIPLSDTKTYTYKCAVGNMRLDIHAISDNVDLKTLKKVAVTATPINKTEQDAAANP